ncbi:MAG: DNA alkylation repair protein [Actinomycetales bacterium]
MSSAGRAGSTGSTGSGHATDSALSGPPVAQAVRAELAAAADPGHAEFLAGYFRTGPGGYGEGDVFLGVRIPHVRDVARRHGRAATDDDLAALLADPVHEHRFAALAVLDGRARAAARRGPGALEPLARFYLAHADAVDNWDLVDVSAPHVLGTWLATTTAATEPDDGAAARILDGLVASPSRWRRRIAVMATWAFTRDGRPGWTLAVAGRLVGERDDLVHKATGWMLREVGHRDHARLLDFLDTHHHRLARVTVRYAVEKLPPEVRACYVTRRRE